MTEVKKKPVKTVEVTYEQFTAWDFIPCGSFYIRDALGNYLFLKTSNRAEAQAVINERYGKGKYNVVAAKLEKGISRLESGEYSACGTSTRRGQFRG